jgi:hypothetical protein
MPGRRCEHQVATRVGTANCTRGPGAHKDPKVGAALGQADDCPDGRVARVHLAGWDDAGVRPRYSETEYTRVLTPPAQFVDRNIPFYFRLPGGRIRIGISFGL